MLIYISVMNYYYNSIISKFYWLLQDTQSLIEEWQLTCNLKLDILVTFVGMKLFLIWANTSSPIDTWSAYLKQNSYLIYNNCRKKLISTL